jgi:hypothetical protein
MSARILSAAAMLGYGYASYRDGGVYWVGLLAVASVVVIVLVKRHQGQQAEQIARMSVKSRPQPEPPEMRAPPPYGERRS